LRRTMHNRHCASAATLYTSTRTHKKGTLCSNLSRPTYKRYQSTTIKLRTAMEDRLNWKKRFNVWLVICFKNII